MLQSLLRDRFHLLAHWEKKEMAAYSLLAGRDRLKLRPEAGEPEVPGCKSFGTLSDFADLLSHSLGKPVVNQTEIRGTFYFILAYRNLETASMTDRAPPSPPPCPGWSARTMPPLASSIFEAVKEQMGLRLERRGTKIIDLLVVDQAQKIPEGN